MNNEPRLMTKCFNCKHASGKNKCAWADHFGCVEGWKAEPYVISRGRTYETDSFLVYSCPQYEKGHHDLRYTNRALRRLATAVLTQAVEDWNVLGRGKIEEIKYKGDVVKRDELVEFFYGGSFNLMLQNTIEYSPGTIRRALNVPKLEVTG